MTGLGWGLQNLGRHPLRTALSLAGIAVASAMLLDMVMLSGGIEKSFSELLLARGYQIRITPKGTLPFDTEAVDPGRDRLVRAIRAEPGVAAAGAVLGTAVYGRTADSLVTLFGYGIQPEAQGIYQVTERRRPRSRRHARHPPERARRRAAARRRRRHRDPGRPPRSPDRRAPAVDRRLVGARPRSLDLRLTAGSRRSAPCCPVMQRLGRDVRGRSGLARSW